MGVDFYAKYNAWRDRKISDLEKKYDNDEINQSEIEELVSELSFDNFLDGAVDYERE